MAYGTNVASSYGYSQTQSIPSSQNTVFEFDSVYVEEGTRLTNNDAGRPTRVTVQTQGLYEIITSIQLNNSTATPTNAYTWIRVNGVDSPSSNGGLLVPPNASAAALIAVPYLVALNPFDYIEIVIRTGSSGISAVAFPSTDSAPAGPSIALNIKQVAVDIGTTF
jgi:hypothetical protein